MPAAPAALCYSMHTSQREDAAPGGGSHCRLPLRDTACAMSAAASEAEKWTLLAVLAAECRMVESCVACIHGQCTGEDAAFSQSPKRVSRRAVIQDEGVSSVNRLDQCSTLFQQRGFAATNAESTGTSSLVKRRHGRTRSRSRGAAPWRHQRCWENICLKWSAPLLIGAMVTRYEQQVAIFIRRAESRDFGYCIPHCE
eukprot:6210011-Pleurochrysis_carterae.AAC.2